MADQLQLRGGTTNEHSTFTGALREVTVDTDKDTLIVHDAATAGGHPLLREDGSNSALSLGTAGTPSLKFTGDTNTGIYSPGADQVAVATNGAGRLFVDASGNVGVGLTPASYAGYSVIGHGSTTGATLEQRVNGALVGSLTTDSQVTLKASTAIPIVFGTNNTERLRITSAGLVGIGVSSPTEKLQVDGNAIFKATNSYIGLQNASGTSTGYIQGQSSFLAIAGGSGSSNTIAFYPASTEAMRIDSSGRVGIGTANPLKELQINATTPTIRLEENGAGSKRLELSVNSSAEAKVFAEQSGSHLLFGTVGTERARLDSSGRLLVGTSSGSGNSTAHFQGNSGASIGGAFISLQRGATNPSNGTELATISFADNAPSQGARIQAFTDGDWAASDYPTRLSFSTTASGTSSPTEWMRISNRGLTTIYAATGGAATGPLTASTFYAGQNGSRRIIIGKHSATNVDNGTVCFYVDDRGNVLNTNNSYGAISDIKLKENIVDANSQWDDLKALRVRNYNLKEGQTHTQIGLVAQEAELVSPGLVSESPDCDEDGNDLGTVTKSVNYSVLYMKAVKALQEAMERIETLEQRLSDAGIA
jgi:hypothetical protein